MADPSNSSPFQDGPPGSYGPPPPPPGGYGHGYGYGYSHGHDYGYGYGYGYGGYPGHGPYPAPHGYDPYGRPYSDKSKIAAGLLQLTVGYFGVGRFYTGHTGIAVAQLLTCGGCGVWALIDGIILLATDSTDPHGRPLRG
ncbi:TM2 domain-containing protein [Streptomyces sp. 4N509B]|uniref:TM2 domain-containing protein n=1 Tax=Streptomyces sp. 4N509B TaxID=3457413 RepID=UPI003FD665D4